MKNKILLEIRNAVDRIENANKQIEMVTAVKNAEIEKEENLIDILLELAGVEYIEELEKELKV